MARSSPPSVAIVIAAACAASSAQARELSFSGYTWIVKNSRGSAVGPGPNVFSDSTDNAWVDTSGRLHLRIVKQGETWTCVEVIAKASLGYGTYRVTYDTPVDDLDPNVVLALFTWKNAAAQWHREIDIEFSRWGNPGNPANAQYVVQPSRPSRISRWLVPGSAPSTHSFRWQPGFVRFESLAGTTHQQWLFAGKAPIPGGENPRMNLWLFHGAPPTDGQPVEVIISSFTFTP